MKSSIRNVLIIAVAIGVALAGSILYVTYNNGPTGAVPDPPAGQHGLLMVLDERVVNLAPGGKFNYVKVGATLELRPLSQDFYGLTGAARAAKESAQLVEFVWAKPLLLDAIGRVAANQTSTVLLTDDGRTVFKAAIIAAMKAILGGERVFAIYFTDLVMQ